MNENDKPKLYEQDMLDTFKLGFGLMRLPKLADGHIDVEQTKQMVDRFLQEGGTYFDTAYVYDNGESEEAIAKALVERYPRESFTLATKLNAWHMAHDEESAKNQFYTSLKRTGAGYFDYYLLHALMRNNYDKYDDYHLWQFVKELKDQGLIKNVGFSFHADPELLDELLTKHPEIDFIQLQINYADWENPDVQSRANLEVARKHNKPVVVMEPVKGGKLVNLPEPVLALMEKENPSLSPASWAIRFAASQPGIATVLSGMSNIEQMEDNLSYMADFKPLDQRESEVIEEIQEILAKGDEIACTACHYCTDGCPMQIPIPEIFKLFNAYKEGDLEGLKEQYEALTENAGKASVCIECLQCEGACPQQLKITDYLKQAADLFES